MLRRQKALVWSAVPVVLASMAVGACGDSKDSSSKDAAAAPAATTTAASTPAAPPIVAEAKTALAGATTLPTLDTSAEPLKSIAKGKTVGLIPCGLAASACVDWAKAAQKGLAKLGMKGVIVDGKLTPKGYNDAMQQLIQQKADAIIKFAIPDSATVAAMAAAKKANIPVLCSVCGNYADKPISTPSLASSDVDYALQGKLDADYAIANSDGKAKIAIFKFTLNTANRLRAQGAADEVKKCTTCKLVANTELQAAGDLNANARNLTTATLSKYPKGELDYIIPPSDTQAVGVVQALQAAHRPEVKVLGFDCDLQNMDYIRKGTSQVACANTPLAQLGWASVDQIARIFAKQPTTNVKVPFQMVSKDSLPPAGQPSQGPDYEPFYLKLWGVS